MARQRRRTTAAGNKLLADPPADFASVDPSYVDLAPGTVFYRVYSPEPYKTTPAGCRRIGPFVRFDHHRPRPDGKARRDRARGVLYASERFLCSMGESFGDLGEVKLDGNRLAKLVVDEEIRLLDLTGVAATGVGTTQAIGADGRRKFTQGWARYFYDHPDLAEAEGLLFTSSHTGLGAIAIWERAEGKVHCPRGQHWALDDPLLSVDIQTAASKLHLPQAA